ncbi:MAG TPA: hypothetical protein VJL29_05365 [Thermoguttaceae bacterium]|nr:hypothetical protein [Thermoguttaceae bacterium]
MAFFISVLPSNAFRAAAYRLLFGYKIQRAKIGFGTVINVKSAELSHCAIGRFNRFAGPMSIIIKNNVIIGHHNRFQCDQWTVGERFQAAGYRRLLEIQENAFITSFHHFDVAGAFVLGKNSWIAGLASQFWTHGAGATDRDIFIGDNCYVGSAVRFSPGSGIGNNVLVALGSVVTKRMDRDNCMVGGVPARILKEHYEWKIRKHVEPD